MCLLNGDAVAKTPQDQEEEMSRFLGAAVLGISLMMPVAIVHAQDHDRDHDTMQAKTHEWNEHEDQAWHSYLKERHKKDHDWAKASKREQKDYWKWRDAHPDSH